MIAWNGMIKINRQTGSCFFIDAEPYLLLAQSALHEVPKPLMQGKI